MRVVALDIGERRVGVAISDPAGVVATPLEVLDAQEAARPGGKLQRIVEDYEVEIAVVGLPLSMDGTEGPQARHVREVAGRMARFLPVSLQFVDERLSSVEAKRRMREAGYDERRQRGSVDMVAASILLQDYLDARAASQHESS